MRTSEASLHGARSGLTGGLFLLETMTYSSLTLPRRGHRLGAAMRNWAREAGLSGVEAIEVSSLEFVLESERHQNGRY